MKKPFAIMLALIMVLAFIPAAATTAATSGTEITITKEWENDNEANRPQFVQVQLLEDKNVVKNITLTAEANWTVTFSYTQDPDKTYTIEEVNVPTNYTPSYTAPVEEKLTVGNWGYKITPASDSTYTLTGNIVVANKGKDYYIWTQVGLTDPQKNKLMAAINDANLEGLGKALAAGNTEFKDGLSATFDGSGVIIEKDGNNTTTINFSDTKVWSLFYEGTLSITPATGWIVKNTYKAPEQRTYTLDVSKTVVGLPDNVNRPSPITVSLMQAGNNTPVSSASLTWDANNNKYSGQLTGIPGGEYTIKESGANVDGYTYEMQAFVPVVGELSVELEPSASLVSNPSPSTPHEPALAELQNNIITVTKDGELILKNTYTKTESDPETETVTISIPISKEVRQGGNTAPGKQTFTFVLSDFGVDDLAPQVKVENNTIKTNGAGHYETVMTVTVTIDKKNFGNLLEGFKVTERNDGAPYWAYDATEWYVMPGMNDDQSTYCTFYNQTAGDKETQTPYNGISFTNIYTYNYNGGYYPAPVRPVQPAPLPPQTGDMPLWYAVAQFLGLVK